MMVKKYFILGLVLLSLGVLALINISKSGIWHPSGALDVAYYFVSKENYGPSLPEMIKKSVVVQGRLIERQDAVVCPKKPCPVITRRYLTDLNNNQYVMLVDNAFAKGLPLNKVYILSGVLSEKVDKAQKLVFIYSFEPEKIIP